MHFLYWKLSYNLLRQYYNGLDACSLNAKVGKLVSTCPWYLKSDNSVIIKVQSMCFPKDEGRSGQFWTMSNTGCMSGRGRDNSGNETRAVAARTMAWELWWLLRVWTREIWWQGRASQVPPFRSTAVTGVTRIIFYDWSPDYLQLTSKYKLKCSNCTSKTFWFHSTRIWM